MNHIQEALDANELPELDFSSHRDFKRSLYAYTYKRVCVEAKQGFFHHLNVDDVTPIQVVDSPDPEEPNPLKTHIMYARPSGRGNGEWFMYDGTV